MVVHALRSGICGETIHGGDCDNGVIGAFGLHPRDAERGWAHAARACFALCAQCSNCHHITVSLKNLDCSWYASCGTRVRRELEGYRSASFATSGMRRVRPTYTLPAPEPIRVATTGNNGSDYTAFVHDLTTALRQRPLRPLRALTEGTVSGSSLDFFLEKKAANATHGLWAEFGVWRGTTLSRMLRRHTELAAVPAVIHGFDSFEGLPEKWHVGAGHLSYGTGSFYAGGKPPFQNDRVRWHAGWYRDTVPAWANELARSGEQISFIHMDADLYSSSAQVFEALEEHFASDVWIVFDELINYPKFARHEMLALYRMVRRTRRQLCAVCMQGPSIDTDAKTLAALGQMGMTSFQGSHPQNALVRLSAGAC
jgi:hypothetical protein